jgi:hypothetical protein
MTVCLVMVWGCLLTLGGAVNDEQFNLDFVARTFPAAIVHTMELSSGALACGSGGGRFPGRAAEVVDRRLERCRFAVARQKCFVETIQRASDALSL